VSLLRKRFLCRTLWFIVSLVSGCGVKGPPLSPLLVVPAATELMSVLRLGDRVYIEFQIPSLDTTGERLLDLERVDVYAVTTLPVPFQPGDMFSEEWLDAAIKKANSVRFLEEGTGRTLAQAAIKFCLAQASLVSVLPNITSQDELVEYAAAPETPDLVPEESTKLDELWEEGFYLEPVGTTSDD